MSKLYAVTAEITVLVIADSQDEAEDNALSDYFEDEVREGIGGSAFEHVSSVQVEKRAEIPKMWRSALPWGGDGRRTCLEYVRGKE